MDLDTIVHSENDPSIKNKILRKGKKLITGFSRILNKDNKKYWTKYIKTSPSSFIAHADSLKAAESLEITEKTVIWRHGAVENAILSSPDLNDKIGEILELQGKTLTTNNLKNKLTKRLTVEQAKDCMPSY